MEPNFDFDKYKIGWITILEDTHYHRKDPKANMYPLRLRKGQKVKLIADNGTALVVETDKGERHPVETIKTDYAKEV